LLNSGQKQRHKHADDGNDYEQFDERKSAGNREAASAATTAKEGSHVALRSQTGKDD
jgi:hypothetical protein